MRTWLAGALVAATASGCATGTAPDPPARAAPERVRLSMLVAGDTGKRPFLSRHLQKQVSVARGMEREDRRRPADAVLLLGDNFYWHGLERHELEERIRINLVRPYCRFVALDGPRSDSVRGACERRETRPAPPIHALLGDHDYDSPESPTLQREVVPEFVSNWHVPAAPVETVELGSGVSLVMLDSIALEAGADVAPLVRALAEARGPWRILAVHEPVALARSGGAAVLERRRSYRETVLGAIRAAGVTVHLVLSGEEHNLQIIEMAEPEVALQVVAGSGSRVRELRTDNPRTRFARAQLGFARVDLVDGARGEELVVTVFTTATWPLFARGEPERVARWAVSREGDARDLMAPPTAARLGSAP